MNKNARPAFSLFELLVIIPILGLLMALLLPAVLKVRQAGNRARSVNNLKQIGLALHNYHDSYNVLPPGNDDKNFSVAAKVLPFLEQDNLFKSIDFTKPMMDKANASVRATMVKVFLSPDDPQGKVQDAVAATNYLFNAGSKFSLEDNDGLFYQDSKIRFADVTDGLSNTFMAGETLKGDGGTKAVDVRRQHVALKKEALKDLKEESGVREFADDKNIAGDRCASWMDGRFLQGTFNGTRAINDKRPDVSCEGAGGLFGFRTLTTRTNILMGDGSVRTLDQKVKLETIKLLAGRNDGQVIPDF